ncbi:MAG: ATP-binding protein [Halobacteriaceae archaeon]
MATQAVSRWGGAGTTPWLLTGGGVLSGGVLFYTLVAEVDILAEGVPATLIEMLLFGVPAVGLVYAGYWLQAGAFTDRQVWGIGLFAVSGVLVATVATLVSVLATPAVLTARASFVLFVGTGSEGALVGVLVGAFAATDELRARERAAGEEVATIHSLLQHNIRNRVTVMDGYLTRLLESAGDYDRESADRIRAQHDAVLDLLEDTEVMTEAVAGDIELRSVDLSSVVAEQVELLQSTYEDVTVTADCPDGVWVVADDLLAAVVENVLHNAVVHNDKPVAELDVSVRRDGGRIELRVADNGPGIPDDRKERVFDPEVGEGTGMGLYLVATLIERYGGEVRLSDAEGGGAVVTLELPAA